MEAEDLGCGLTADSITAASAAAAAFTWQAHWQASSRWPAATATAAAAAAAAAAWASTPLTRTGPVRSDLGHGRGSFPGTQVRSGSGRALVSTSNDVAIKPA